jgi:hypothetical protein
VKSAALALCLLSLAWAAGEDAGTGRISVKPVKPGDRAVVSSKDPCKPVVTITSASGIGSATIARSGEDSIILRLDLKALESIEADNGFFTASTFLGSGQAPECWRIDEGGVRVELAGRHPVLAPRRTETGIEVKLGGGLFGPEVGEITIRWVDFHRR